VVNNKGKYEVNLEIHSLNTRQNSSLHPPSSNLATHQKGIAILASRFSKISLHISKTCPIIPNNLNQP
jgi:hypothetical protein